MKKSGVIGTSDAYGSSADRAAAASASDPTGPDSDAASGAAARISLTIAAAEANDCPDERKKSGSGRSAAGSSTGGANGVVAPLPPMVIFAVGVGAVSGAGEIFN